MAGLKSKNFVIVTHKLFYGISDDLQKYLLNRKCKRLWIINHEFASYPGRKSHLYYYADGVLLKSISSPNLNFLPDFLVNIKDVLFTVFCLIFLVGKIDMYIGLGAINVLPAIFLKKQKTIKKIIFYTIDYVPMRFTNPILNFIYHKIDKLALSFSTQTWNLSPRMVEGRQASGLLTEHYPNQKVVPVGIWFDDIKRPQFSKINKHELIFVGHLLEKQGVQVVISAIPLILEQIPNFTFRVIGGGVYENKLKKLVRQKRLEKHVFFEGAIYDQVSVNKLLTKAAVAVAMYSKEKDDFTYYADSSKIKTYLSCGLPILLTDLPYNAYEIEENNCGKIVSYNSKSVAEAVLEIMKDVKRLKIYRNNVIKYAKKFDWNKIFDNSIN